MKFTGAGARVLLLGALLMGPPAAARAQEEPPPATEGAPQSPPAADQGIHPDAVSSFQVRTYKTSPKKLWRGLLQTLEASGYPPEEVDEKGKRVKTAFVDFKSIDYSEAVADPAPRFGPDYQILQMKVVKMGKVSIEGIVSKGENGAAVLSLRARILTEGLDKAKGVRLLTDRRSSGVIESDFLRVFEDTLSLERL